MSTLKIVCGVFVLALVTLFCAFNTNNSCDVNLIFTTAKDVPVFVSLMVAFLSGVVVMIPVLFLNKAVLGKKNLDKKNPDEKKSDKSSLNDSDFSEENTDTNAKKESVSKEIISEDASGGDVN